LNVPDDLKYLESHEWHRIDGDVVTIGISQFAAEELTDITYLELPAAGTAVQAGTVFGEIESVKATADLNSGITGNVTETNARLSEEPELVNSDPFGDGWMIRVKVTDPSELDRLLSPSDYAAIIQS
jgi:glycine cleavage system H protein